MKLLGLLFFACAVVSMSTDTKKLIISCSARPATRALPRCWKVLCASGVALGDHADLANRSVNLADAEACSQRLRHFGPSPRSSESPGRSANNSPERSAICTLAVANPRSLSRRAAAFGQIAHFTGDDCKAAAVFTGTARFDAGSTPACWSDRQSLRYGDFSAINFIAETDSWTAWPLCPALAHLCAPLLHLAAVFGVLDDGTSSLPCCWFTCSTRLPVAVP